MDTVCERGLVDSMEEALYVSKAHPTSLWQEYRVYPDRLELVLHLFGRQTIHLGDVKNVEIRPPLAVGDLFRGRYTLPEVARTLKVDLADLNEHIVIEKETGFWRQFRITPDSLSGFLAAFHEARGTGE